VLPELEIRWSVKFYNVCVNFRVKFVCVNFRVKRRRACGRRERGRHIRGVVPDASLYDFAGVILKTWNHICTNIGI